MVLYFCEDKLYDKKFILWFCIGFVIWKKEKEKRDAKTLEDANNVLGKTQV